MAAGNGDVNKEGPVVHVGTMIWPTLFAVMIARTGSTTIAVNSQFTN